MKVTLASLISVCLLFAFAATGAAAPKREKQRRQVAPPTVITEQQRRRNAEAYKRGEYYEHDSNALPIGSDAWFRQKEREDGCC